jgi:hypothetical protein
MHIDSATLQALSTYVTAPTNDGTKEIILRPRLHWSQNRHNTTVWTDSRKEVDINHITVNVSGYTETDPTLMLSPNNSRLFGANKVGSFLGRGYIAARTDTTQQSGQTPDKEVDINHITVNVSGYTETDTTLMLSPNNSRLFGANRVGLFRDDSLARYLLQCAEDSSVVAVDKTYLIELLEI